MEWSSSWIFSTSQQKNAWAIKNLNGELCPVVKELSHIWHMDKFCQITQFSTTAVLSKRISYWWSWLRHYHTTLSHLSALNSNLRSAPGTKSKWGQVTMDLYYTRQIKIVKLWFTAHNSKTLYEWFATINHNS